MHEAEHNFQSFSEFYPYYLKEHQHPVSRRLHFSGTLIVILLFLGTFLTSNYKLLIVMPIAGYGFAWAGHFFFEKNRPATFKHPFFSLMGDFVMFWEILTGKIKV